MKSRISHFIFAWFLTMLFLLLAWSLWPRGEYEPPATPGRERTGSAPEVGSTSSRLPEPSRLGEDASFARAGGPTLVIVSAGEDRPIAGAVVRLGEEQDEDPTEPSLESDAAGRVELPRAGRVALTLDAVGHAIFAGVFDLDEDEERVFRLRPAGSLELEFVDEEGRPVPEIAARLLYPVEEPGRWRGGWRDTPFPPERVPALQGFEPAEGWGQQTGAGGVLRWNRIPAASGYRWGSLSNRPFETVPPYEAPEIEFEGETVRSRSGLPRDLSGPFAVHPGRVTRFRIPVPTPGVVFGQVRGSGGAPVRPAMVKLFHQRGVENDRGGPGVLVNEFRAHVEADASGNFRFSSVEPGRNSIRFIVEEEGQQFSFGRRSFEITAGESRDLGVIFSTEGSSVECAAVCEDSRGTVLLPAEVLAFERDARVVIVLSLRPADGREEAFLAEAVAVTLGEPFTLHGLPEGNLVLRLRSETGEPLLPRDPGARVVEPGPLQVAVPVDEMPRLVVRVDPTLEQTIRALFPRDVAPCVCDVHLRHQDTGESFSSRALPSRAAGGASTVASSVTKLQIPPGGYDLLIHTMTETERDLDTSLFGRGILDAGAEGQQLEIEMLPAARVRGRVVDAAGEGVPRAPVFLSFGVWNEGPRAPAIYRTLADPEGRFLLRGVVPHVTLSGPSITSSIEVGAASSTVDVEVSPR